MSGETKVSDPSEATSRARALLERYEGCFTWSDLSIRQIKHEVLIELRSLLQRVETLETGLRGLLAEPHGCSLCDSGKPRNWTKGHQPDCPYEVARAALARGEAHRED